MMDYEHQMISTNGIQLHVVQAGPKAGPLVILLHGFPEFWYGWKKQNDYLAERGFRVWIPDQRGYNLSDKPKGVAAYNLDTLAADILGLMDASGQEQVYLAGHDWGAIVAWWIAIHHPQRLKKLVIANVPHPVAFVQNLRSSPSQMRKSWYVLFLQLPRLPEYIIAKTGPKAFQNTSMPGAFSDDDLNHYAEAWAQPGALTAMVNWYRAILRHRPSTSANIRVRVPALIIWGKLDVALDSEMAQPSIDLCDDGRLVMFEDATHWVQHDKAAEVSALMAKFFSEA